MSWTGDPDSLAFLKDSLASCSSIELRLGKEGNSFDFFSLAKWSSLRSLSIYGVSHTLLHLIELPPLSSTLSSTASG